MKRPAFTLIELLITAALFVAVAGFATAAFVTTGRLQSSNRQSQVVATQGSAVNAKIEDAVRRAVNQTVAFRPRIVPTGVNQGNGNLPNDLLAVYVRRAQSDGSVSSLITDDEWEVFCLEEMAGVSRVVRYRLPNGAAFNDSINPITCTQAGISAVFGQSASAPEYLSDTAYDVTALHFSGVVANASQLSNPPTIRIELTVRYDASNTSGIEQRAADAATQPGQVVIRTQALRTVLPAGSPPGGTTSTTTTTSPTTGPSTGVIEPPTTGVPATTTTTTSPTTTGVVQPPGQPQPGLD